MEWVRYVRLYRQPEIDRLEGNRTRERLMKRIFGMAKSPLDLRGAKGRNLELDFLRLVYAVEHFRASGDEAQGYLLVMAESIRMRVAEWIRKYDAADCVELVVTVLSPEQASLLAQEKARNRQGNAPGADRALAVAADGKRLGEVALRRHVLAAEPAVTEVQDGQAPFGIRWDFYGLVRSGRFDLGKR